METSSTNYKQPTTNNKQPTTNNKQQTNNRRPEIYVVMTKNLQGFKEMPNLKSRIRGFIVENFLFGNADSLEDKTSFLEEGIIDSTGVLELVTYLEEEFDITIEDEELIPENLDSINNVNAFLETKKG